MSPAVSSAIDEQLLRSGHLTKEGIEERLRMLEGVQRSIWKAVEDLTMISSVLPSASASSLATPTVDEKGKGKAPETELDNTSS